MAFELNIEWDDLEGSNRSGKLISLIEELKRQNRLGELAEWLREKRPSVEWPDVPTSTQPPRVVPPQQLPVKIILLLIVPIALIIIIALITSFNGNGDFLQGTPISAIAPTLSSSPASSTPTHTLLPSPSPTPNCSLYTELGPWETKGDVYIDAKDGWVQADFWSPGRIMKEGHDELSVIFEPGLEVVVVGVAGNGWKYSPTWSREDVEHCLLKHIYDSQIIRHKELLQISLEQLCNLTVCK